MGGARIQELATGSAKPGNVATFVAVTEKDKPVAGLPPSAFKISENNQPIDSQVAELQLLETARYASFHALLLVDISQAKEAGLRRTLAKAAGAFVRRARQGQSVTVVAYDGSDKVRIVGEYPADAKATTPEQVDALLSLTPGDPSRNLRGAVVQGLEISRPPLGDECKPGAAGHAGRVRAGAGFGGTHAREPIQRCSFV